MGEAVAVTPIVVGGTLRHVQPLERELTAAASSPRRTSKGVRYALAILDARWIQSETSGSASSRLILSASRATVDMTVSVAVPGS